MDLRVGDVITFRDTTRLADRSKVTTKVLSIDSKNFERPLTIHYTTFPVNKDTFIETVNRKLSKRRVRDFNLVSGERLRNKKGKRGLTDDEPIRTKAQRARKEVKKSSRGSTRKLWEEITRPTSVNNDSLQ